MVGGHQVVVGLNGIVEHRGHMIAQVDTLRRLEDISCQGSADGEVHMPFWTDDAGGHAL